MPGLLLSAALSAAFPHLSESAAVSGVASPLFHGSNGMYDSSFGGASRPQWADEVFSDVMTDYQDWELRLNPHDGTHPQPGIFTCAVDMLTADIMKIYRQAV